MRTCFVSCKKKSYIKIDPRVLFFLSFNTHKEYMYIAEEGGKGAKEVYIKKRLVSFCLPFMVNICLMHRKYRKS